MIVDEFQKRKVSPPTRFRRASDFVRGFAAVEFEMFGSDYRLEVTRVELDTRPDEVGTWLGGGPMKLLGRLFGSSESAQQRRERSVQSIVDPLDKIRRNLVPTDDSDTAIMRCVTQSIAMAGVFEVSQGRELDLDGANVAVRCKEELDTIQQARQKRGFSYREIETMFWCPAFVLRYKPLSIKGKKELLDSLPDDVYKGFLRAGQSGREENVDAVVCYVTAVAFESLKFELRSFLRPAQYQPALGADAAFRYLYALAVDCVELNLL